MKHPNIIAGLALLISALVGGVQFSEQAAFRQLYLSADALDARIFELEGDARARGDLDRLDVLEDRADRHAEALRELAQSLQAVAVTCPGREWPPGWDRIRALAEIDPPPAPRVLWGPWGDLSPPDPYVPPKGELSE